MIKFLLLTRATWCACWLTAQIALLLDRQAVDFSTFKKMLEGI